MISITVFSDHDDMNSFHDTGRNDSVANAAWDNACQSAWNWLIRQFDSEKGLDEAAEVEFQGWLGADELNFVAYDRALSIWTAARCLAREKRAGTIP